MQPYLTESGKTIYKAILAYTDRQNWSHDIDSYELSMLANSFDTYSKCAEVIKKEGHTQMTKTGFLATRPEVGIMQKAHAEILKHSAKFGLNPGDRKRIFKLAEKRRKKKIFSLTQGEEREAFITWWESVSPVEVPVDMTLMPKYVAYCSEHFQEPGDVFDLI